MSITLSQFATLPWAVYQSAYAASVTQQLSMLGIEPRPLRHGDPL